MISPTSLILLMSSFQEPATRTCFSHTHSFRTVRPPLRLALALHPIAVGKSSGMSHLIRVLATVRIAIRAATSIGVHVPTLETYVTPAARSAKKEPPIIIAERSFARAQRIPTRVGILHIIVVPSPVHPLIDPFATLRARHPQEHVGNASGSMHRRASKTPDNNALRTHIAINAKPIYGLEATQTHSYSITDRSLLNAHALMRGCLHIYT